MWDKRDDMVVRTESPFNAEPPAPVLAVDEITPVDVFYARNHGEFPDIAPTEWRVTVDGLVDRPLTLTYCELTSDFDPHCVRIAKENVALNQLTGVVVKRLDVLVWKPTRTWPLV